MAALAAGCRPPPGAKMETGQAIEVRRDYCIADPQLKQGEAEKTPLRDG